ncbi:unnamed protein product [Haemonchus placei]|uniref:EGF-like domain-containing protein n=1 Tax=Haemonchus placei TaxID=6290 RepID=A0A0N4WI97_HAEPC|nr:unnamed protein product [Haemonchus placei]
MERVYVRSRQCLRGRRCRPAPMDSAAGWRFCSFFRAPTKARKAGCVESIRYWVMGGILSSFYLHISVKQIDDPPELLDRTRPPEYDNDKGHRRPSYETNEIHESDDESESEELDMIYGTAAPIRVDHRLEEARRRHSKRKCKGWCYRGGNCTVDIDEITYELRSVNCHCPHGYWGNRCELHFVARLFAPVKGNVDVEKSGVSAFAFIILMLIVSIGLIFYTYRKLARRNTAIDSSTLPSLNYHLRRQSVSFQTMPTSVNASPTNSTASTARSALTQLNCRTPFSPFFKSYSHISGDSRNSINDLTPSLNMAFERLSTSSVTSEFHSDLSKTDSKKKQQLNKKPAPSLVRSDYVMTNQGHGYDDELRPVTKSSDYLMDQIHLEKRTPTEIKEELNREDLKPSPVDEPLRSVEPCPSEYQLAALNDQLVGFLFAIIKIKFQSSIRCSALPNSHSIAQPASQATCSV